MSNTPAFSFTDIDGRRWKVRMRGRLQHVRSGKQLFEMKQRHADEQRALGREALAKVIEAATIIRWASGNVASTALLIWSTRLDERGREIR